MPLDFRPVDLPTILAGHQTWGPTLSLLPFPPLLLITGGHQRKPVQTSSLQALPSPATGAEI